MVANGWNALSVEAEHDEKRPALLCCLAYLLTMQLDYSFVCCRQTMIWWQQTMVWCEQTMVCRQQTKRIFEMGCGIRLCLAEKSLMWREIFWWASIRFKRLTGQHHTSRYNPCRWGLNLLCSAVLIGWGSIVVAFVGSDFGASGLTFNRAYERD